MGIIQAKAFKSGNSVAVRLPRELGIDAGDALRIEKVGAEIRISPALDPAEEKRKLNALVERLLSLPAPGEIEKRVPIEFPDRPGLY